jgi:preprotein translocase subunit SecE
VAERRRRGEDPADDRRDDALADDELIDDIDDVDDVDDFDETDEGDDDGDGESTGRVGRRTATKARPKPAVPAGRKSTKSKSPERSNIFARLMNFFREVVAELRKVIWPTRKELLTYTAVVVVFLVIMVTIVGLMDVGLAKATLWVFGNETTPAAGE